MSDKCFACILWRKFECSNVFVFDDMCKRDIKRMLTKTTTRWRHRSNMAAPIAIAGLLLEKNAERRQRLLFVFTPNS